MEDSLNKIVEMLKNDWNKDNVDNTQPIIEKIFAFKRLDLGIYDYILVYQTSHVERPIGLGYNFTDYEHIISIDIRTMHSRDRLIKLLNEVRRIIFKNRKGYGGYKFLSIERINDLSDKTIKMWRIVLDLKLWKVIEHV